MPAVMKGLGRAIRNMTRTPSLREYWMAPPRTFTAFGPTIV